MRMQVTLLRSFCNRILALVLGLVTLVMAATISAIVLKAHRAGDDGNYAFRYLRLVFSSGVSAEMPAFCSCCNVGQYHDLPDLSWVPSLFLSSTIVRAEVSGSSVESLARVFVQTAFPRESCSTRPPGPRGLRGNFGRTILAVSLMEYVP